MIKELEKRVIELTEQKNVIRNKFYNVVLSGDYKTANKLARKYKKIDYTLWRECYSNKSI